MNKNKLFTLIEPYLDQLFSFAFAMVGDEQTSLNIINDAYTVFIMKERDTILELEEDNDKALKYWKNTLIFSLYEEIYQLARKRELEQENIYLGNDEFSEYFKLSLFNRALLFLKHIDEMSMEKLEMIFALERHELVEALYNANYKLSQIDQSFDGKIWS